MLCSDTSTWTTHDPGPLGTWNATHCPTGQKICGMQPNVLAYGSYDNVGMARGVVDVGAKADADKGAPMASAKAKE